ncbi:hypothetical protein HZ326_27947 [Fusarium oxysporum f. sp. albedinis]|nr:hypothetical protein HZ326_27947 [Fusarium oxysporum f. sp. albedinis]
MDKINENAHALTLQDILWPYYHGNRLIKLYWKDTSNCEIYITARYFSAQEDWQRLLRLTRSTVKGEQRALRSVSVSGMG